MSSNLVPSYKVHLNGSELPQADDIKLQSIIVDLRRQAPASLELQFNNHDGDYDDRPDLAPGTVIKVALGYTEGGNTTVFEGEVIGTQVRVADNGPRLFVVRAFDYLHRLTRGRKTRTFLDSKFSDIIAQLGGDWSLSPDCEDTGFVREYVLQHNQTDLDFARGISGWLDFDLHIRHLEDGKKLRFRAPEVGATPSLKAVYEKPDLPAGDAFLRKFDGRLSLARVVSEVVVRGWDPTQKKEIIGRASDDKLYGRMGGDASAVQEITEKWGETDRQLVDYKVFSTEEADVVARTKINEYARTFIRADVELEGNPKVHPGGIVEVARVGPRMDGPYFVDRVTHTFLSKVGVAHGFTTRFIAARCGW